MMPFPADHRGWRKGPANPLRRYGKDDGCAVLACKMQNDRGDGYTITAAVFPQNEKEPFRRATRPKESKHRSSRSSDLRINSAARLLGAYRSNGRLSPVRHLRAYSGGTVRDFHPYSLFSPSSLRGRQSTRQNSIVKDIIRRGGRFVNRHQRRRCNNPYHAKCLWNAKRY